MTILIAGAGIGGLTFALSLHQLGVPCRVYEATSEIKPLGVGINVLPHAMRELGDLGLEPTIAKLGVETQEYSFHNRFGQFIHAEPRGRFAGYDWPQYSIHRGVLQLALLQAVLERLGPDAVVTGHALTHGEETTDGVIAHFAAPDGSSIASVTGSALVGCDGIRSALRRQFYPTGDPLIYSGITMWRGLSRWKPFRTGATMSYSGWIEGGKAIFYPIESELDDQGRQLTNCLLEFYVPPRDPSGDWSRPGKLEDFIDRYEDMKFDWLDIPACARACQYILEYPMVDRDPLPRWSHGAITLMGDAAHPMYPRGSNGAGQAILDARTLAGHLARHDNATAAFKAYEDDRREITAAVVLANRTNPPDAILREIYQRTGDKPFDDIDKVITRDELTALSESYKQIAGFQRETLKKRPGLV